ncbi:MAG TPA: creatininase family protein [Pirellulales bacterium]
MQLQDMTWDAVAELSKDTPIVFPVAALEQHGRHMPLFTDSLLLAEVVHRAAGRFEAQAVFAPLLWLGNSDHHLDFSGTLSAPPRTYLDVLGGLLDNFVMHGFRRLLIINGHGGNNVPGQQTVFEVRQRYRRRNDLLLLFATYWLLGAKPHEIEPTIKQQRMGHACEWETSMMLRLAPHLVRNHQQAEAVPFGKPFEPASRGWITRERTQPGHIGDPRSATAEKGEVLLHAFSDDLAALVERMLAWDGKSWDG